MLQLPTLMVQPIGVIRTPFLERAAAPRQPAASRDTPGTIELLPGHDFEHALSDLDAWDHIWVIFWFHLNSDWRPKVLPPRSRVRRGVFSTRSPHRPNPLGLSVLRLDAVDRSTRVLHVRDVDMLDGTPVIDIKPYVPYADSVPHAKTGWLDREQASSPRSGELVPQQEAGGPPHSRGPSGAGTERVTPSDPLPAYHVAWTPDAAEQADWITREEGSDFVTRVNAVLALGPEPHPYRRIKADGTGFCLALKAWRVHFRVAGTQVDVRRVATGYRAQDLARSADPTLAAHRAFVARFGGPAVVR